MSIYLVQKAQIALLLAKKVIILAKYSNFVNVFLEKLTAKLLNCFNINKYLTNQELGKLPFYRLIYSLKPVELKTLKIYLKINLTSDFIYLFKLPTKTFIFFV